MSAALAPNNPEQRVAIARARIDPQHLCWLDCALELFGYSRNALRPETAATAQGWELLQSVYAASRQEGGRDRA